MQIFLGFKALKYAKKNKLDKQNTVKLHWTVKKILLKKLPAGKRGMELIPNSLILWIPIIECLWSKFSSAYNAKIFSVPKKFKLDGYFVNIIHNALTSVQ